MLEVPEDGVHSLRAAGPEIDWRTGYLLRSDITVGKDGFLPLEHTDSTLPSVRISTWVYSATIGLPGAWAYTHVTFEITEVPPPMTFEELLGLYLRALILAQLQAEEALFGGLGPDTRVVPILRIADR